LILKDKIYKDRLEIDKRYWEKIEHEQHFFYCSIFEWVYDWNFSFDDGEVESL
jgi:hypothetical protein